MKKKDLRTMRIATYILLAEMFIGCSACWVIGIIWTNPLLLTVGLLLMGLVDPFIDAVSNGKEKR